MDVKVEDFKGTAFFDGFSYDDIQSVIDHTTPVNLKSGQSLFSEGDEGEAMFIVHSGELQITKGLRKEGAKEVVAVLGRGQSIGEMALFTQDKRSASVQAGSGEVILVEIDKAALKKLESEHPEAAYKIYKNIISLLVQRFGKLSAKKDRFSFWLGG